MFSGVPEIAIIACLVVIAVLVVTAFKHFVRK